LKFCVDGVIGVSGRCQVDVSLISRILGAFHDLIGSFVSFSGCFAFQFVLYATRCIS